MLGFLWTRRLFRNPVRLDLYAALVFEAILALNLFVIWTSLGDLDAFDAHQAVVAVSPYAFTMFAGLGIYGVRLAMFIAIGRGNRAPQVAEWIVTLLGIFFCFACLLLGGTALDAYARAHGYQRCADSAQHRVDARFALRPGDCAVVALAAPPARAGVSGRGIAGASGVRGGSTPVALTD